MMRSKRVALRVPSRPTLVGLTRRQDAALAALGEHAASTSTVALERLSYELL